MNSTHNKKGENEDEAEEKVEENEQNVNFYRRCPPQPLSQ